MCPECNGAGWYLEPVPFGHPQFGKLIPCGCTLAAREQRAAERRQAMLGTLASELGILAKCTFDSYDPSWPTEAAVRRGLATARDAVRTYAADPQGDWLWLHGPVGTGKSHLAAAATMQLARAGRLTYYRSVPGMLNALRAGYTARDFDERLEALIRVPVLVLDDLGAENSNEASSALLFQIVNDRVRDPDALIIVTSNVSPVEYGMQDRRLASRLAGRARIVPVVAGDYRLQRAPALRKGA